jgi:uncharacterized protein (TIGR02678 family)
VTPASQSIVTISSPEVEPERRRALRALLRNPLLSSAGETAEEYVLVRRHSEWLEQWLARFPAWTIHINGEVARLRKTPADLIDETRAAVDRSSGTTFTKRRYALLCLSLAALEQLDRQTTLGLVAQTIMELVAADRDLQAAGLFFDSGNYDQRRDLVHAVRFLVDMGVLRKLDGDEQQFQSRSDSSDVLYDINRHILSEILHLAHSVSALETAAQRFKGNSLAQRAARLGAHPIPTSDEEHHLGIRSRLVRALLDDPILYYQDLSDEERTYLEKHRGYLLREICEATGLIAEVRREGIALVDDIGDLSDLKLPDQGSDAHLSLLLAQWFAECFRHDAGMLIPVSVVEGRVRALIHIHGSEWQKELGEAGAESRLTEDALLRLRSLRLIQVTNGGVVPLAASCRYAAAESTRVAMNGTGNEE